MKKAIKVVLLLILISLIWAPWMNDKILYEEVLKDRAHIDGTIDKQTGRQVCDYNVSWFPFGRYIASCEGSYFAIFWGEIFYPKIHDNFSEKEKSLFTLGNKYADKAVQEYFLSNEYFSWKTAEGSRNFCVFEKLDAENELFPFYLWLRCGEFIMQDNVLQETSGKSGPVKIDYPNEMSFYDLKRFSHSAPRDGSLYEKDIKTIFPSDIQKKIINFDTREINERIKNFARENFQ